MTDLCLCLIIKDDSNQKDIIQLINNINKTFGKMVTYKVFFSDINIHNVQANEKYNRCDFQYAINMCKGRSDYILYLESDRLFEGVFDNHDLIQDYYVDKNDWPFLFKNRYSYNWSLDSLNKYTKGQLDLTIIKNKDLDEYNRYFNKTDDQNWEQYEEKLLKAYELLKRIDPLLKISEHYRITNQYQKSYEICKKTLSTDNTKNQKILDELSISSYYVSKYIESFLYNTELLKYTDDQRIKNNLRFAEDKLKNFTKKNCLIDIDIYRNRYDYSYLLKIIDIYRPFCNFQFRGIGLSMLNLSDINQDNLDYDILICFNNLNLDKTNANKKIVWITEELLFLDSYDIDEIVTQNTDTDFESYKINTKGWEFFDFLLSDNKKKINKKIEKKITFTITTCKRYNLFEQTMDSFLKNCVDKDQITDFICIDDNSSAEDRLKMKQKYPFMTFILKDISQKGHAKSMNILLKYVSSDYIVHWEDDWICHEQFKITDFLNYIINKNIDHLVLKTIAYGTNDVYDKIGNYPIHNYHYNKNSSFKPDINRLYDQMIQHNYANVKTDRQGWWWPGFTLNPSIINLKKIKEIGFFNEFIPHELFEYDYAARCFDNGYVIKYVPLNINHVGFQSSYNLNETKRYYD